MELSIVIVNYNVRYFLEQCLISVRKASKEIHVEVFVVDNNSEDGSVAYLKPMFPEVRFIENNENVGFAKANNQAIALAKGKYILLLNPDTVLGEDVLKSVCSFMDKHPDAGGVGVKMIDGNGNFLPESKRSFPSPWVSFCKIAGLNWLFPHSRLFGRYHVRYLKEDKIHPIQVMAGAFMMLRAEALEVSGLLDERFFMYGEDIDMSYRLICAGYQNYYLPDKIIHYKGESTKKDSFRYVKIFYEAMFIFFKKHYPHYSPIYGSIIKLAIISRATLSIIKRVMLRLIRMLPQNPKPNLMNRMLILSDPDEYPIIESLLQRAFGKDQVETYRLEVPIADILLISDLIEKKGITDIIYSDTAANFTKMIELIERFRHYRLIHRIYINQSGHLISANQTLHTNGCNKECGIAV